MAGFCWERLWTWTQLLISRQVDPGTSGAARLTSDDLQLTIQKYKFKSKQAPKETAYALQSCAYYVQESQFFLPISVCTQLLGTLSLYSYSAGLLKMVSG
jgi:hypothetical protein